MPFGYGHGRDQGQQIGSMLSRYNSDKPKRTVFNSDMVVHVWAQQSQSYGRNAKGTIYFDGPTIYSYGSHFPMASFVRSTKPGRRHQQCVLLTNKRDSVTTMHHLSMVRRAVPSGNVLVFEVNDAKADRETTHAANLAAMIRSMQASLATVANTRCKPRNRQAALRFAQQERALAETYRAMFLNVKRHPIPALPANIAELQRQFEFTEAEQLYRAAWRFICSPYLQRRKDRYGSLRVTAANAYRAIVRQASRMSRLKRLHGVEGATPICEARRMLKLWRFARRKRFYQIDAPGNGDHTVTTAQKANNYYSGHSSYYPRERTYRPSDDYYYARPQGYRYLDKFALEMKTQAEITAEEREEARREEQYELERRERVSMRDRPVEERLAHFYATGRAINLYDQPVAMTIIGDNVRTSLGAEFPVDHARRAWRVIEKLYATGRTYHKNGHNIHVGHFVIDQIAADGTVYAGCHIVSRSEVEKLAARL